MLTIVLPNRNRKFQTVRRTLESIVYQAPEDINVIVIDYGSTLPYQVQLESLIEEIGNCKLMNCSTQGQLWQKTRAINIALKLCNTPYFMVADMDMLFHSSFAEKVMSLCALGKVFYFQVGVMTEEESKLNKAFNDYEVKFKTNEEATGITLFPTDVLKSINGFDEFYHGWGAEDTDVHVRLRNAGHIVQFYDRECLFLHQWHPKFYRSKYSPDPFHPKLERINQEYLKLTRTHKKTQVNKLIPWGVFPNKTAYAQLKNPDTQLELYATQEEVDAFCFQCKEGLFRDVVHVEIKQHPRANNLKEKLKKILNKKTPTYISLDDVNQNILSLIISNLRNLPYHYKYAVKEEKIIIQINFLSES